MGLLFVFSGFSEGIELKDGRWKILGSMIIEGF